MNLIEEALKARTPFDRRTRAGREEVRRAQLEWMAEKLASLLDAKFTAAGDGDTPGAFVRRVCELGKDPRDTVKGGAF